MIKSVSNNKLLSSSLQYICLPNNSIGKIDNPLLKKANELSNGYIAKECLKNSSSVKLKFGDLFMTNSGALGFKKIIHLIVYENENEKINLKSLSFCLQKLISFCRIFKIKEIGISSLECSYYGLNSFEASLIFKEELDKVDDIIFYIFDEDPFFLFRFK